jgi:hypothetical protein
LRTRADFKQIVATPVSEAANRWWPAPHGFGAERSGTQVGAVASTDAAR